MNVKFAHSFTLDFIITHLLQTANIGPFASKGNLRLCKK